MWPKGARTHELLSVTSNTKEKWHILFQADETRMVVVVILLIVGLLVIGFLYFKYMAVILSIV